jgi:nucleotidyltransferase substrate binding protein (TIGR01987 family)
MSIDLTSFRKALDSLDRGLAKARQAPEDEELRDGAIQRFEYSYELAWKSLKRMLEAEAASPEEIDPLSYRDLIRLGVERGIIEDPSEWFAFREKRNISSHIYDSAKGAEVYSSALAFAPAARRMLEKLEQRNS